MSQLIHFQKNVNVCQYQFLHQIMYTKIVDTKQNNVRHVLKYDTIFLFYKTIKEKHEMRIIALTMPCAMCTIGTLGLSSHSIFHPKLHSGINLLYIYILKTKKSIVKRKQT